MASAKSQHNTENMGKLGTVTYYKKKADTLVSKIVRARGKCEVGKYSDKPCSSQLQNHHYIGRRNMTLRFDLMNCFCICASHHTWYTTQSAEADPQWFSKVVEKHFPKRYAYIQENKNKLTKRTAQDLKDLVKQLQEKLDVRK